LKRHNVHEGSRFKSSVMEGFDVQEAASAAGEPQPEGHQSRPEVSGGGSERYSHRTRAPKLNGGHR
jgi:hypothetical protein